MTAAERAVEKQKKQKEKEKNSPRYQKKIEKEKRKRKQQEELIKNTRKAFFVLLISAAVLSVIYKFGPKYINANTLLYYKSMIMELLGGLR